MKLLEIASLLTKSNWTFYSDIIRELCILDGYVYRIIRVWFRGFLIFNSVWLLVFSSLYCCFIIHGDRVTGRRNRAQRRAIGVLQYNTERKGALWAWLRFDLRNAEYRLSWVNLKSALITYFAVINLSNYTTECFSFCDGAKFRARCVVKRLHLESYFVLRQNGITYFYAVRHFYVARVPNHIFIVISISLSLSTLRASISPNYCSRNFFIIELLRSSNVASDFPCLRTTQITANFFMNAEQIRDDRVLSG